MARTSRPKAFRPNPEIDDIMQALTIIDSNTYADQLRKACAQYVAKRLEDKDSIKTALEEAERRRSAVVKELLASGG